MMFDRDFAARFPDHLAAHGEAVTYYPAQGAARSITALVERFQRQERGGDVEVTYEEVDVTVGRDPGQDGGGIAQPRIGDAVRRATDPVDRRYGFTGEIVDDSPAVWTLRFRRRVPYQVGIGQTRS